MPTLTSLVLNPPAVIAGSPSQGTVTLNGAAPAGGAVVSLSSSATNRATVPATVTIPAGSTSVTFPIQTILAAQEGPVTITAGFGGNLTAQLNLVCLQSIGVIPSQISPGTEATGTLTLTGPVPTPTVANVSSQYPQLVSVPPTVTFPVNTTSVNFPIEAATRSADETSTAVNIIGSLAGVTLSVQLLLI